VIVVRFEEVDIDHDERQGPLRAPRRAPLEAQERVEATAIGDARKPVLEGEILQLLLQAEEPFLRSSCAR
jgi:hypothetical protein